MGVQALIPEFSVEALSGQVLGRLTGLRQLPLDREFVAHLSSA